MYYKFNKDREHGFIKNSILNRDIHNFIGGREFAFTEYDNDGDVTAITFRNGEKIHRRVDLASGFKPSVWGEVIFCTDEIENYLEAVPLVEEKVYAVMVSAYQTTGWMIRTVPSTLKEAEAFAEKWLKENPKDNAIVFKGISRYAAETQVVVSTSPYGA